MDNSAIHVVFLCDENYFYQSFVTAKSAADSASGKRPLFLHFLMTGCTKLQEEAVARLEKPGVKADFRTIPCPDDLKLSVWAYANLNGTVWGKMYIADAFPELDRVIYMDSDILVRGDLAEFYDTDLGGNAIGAVMDIGQTRVHYMKVSPDVCSRAYDGYFNAGVVLMDLKRFREMGILEKFRSAKIMSVSEPYLDQSAFNMVFAYRYKPVHPKWNCLLFVLQKETPERLALFNSMFSTSYKSYDEIVNDALVWHYAGVEKPWNWRSFPHAAEWRRAAKSTEGLYRDPFRIRFRRFLRRVTFWFRETTWPFTKWKNRIIRRTKSRISRFIYSIIREHVERYADGVVSDWGIRGINRDKIACEIAMTSRSGVAESGKGKGIIVSLTSYPGRMYDIHYCLHSLLSQTFRPERIILWLTRDEFPNLEGSIPDSVLQMKKRGLEIRFTDFRGSYTKLLPALKEFPDNPIVTFDDDIYYRPDTLETLVRAWEASPSNIWAVRIREIVRRPDHVPSPFDNRENMTTFTPPALNHLLEGVGGVIYPPHCLDPRIFREDIYMRVAPKGDDLWFWAMAALHGTKIGGTGNGDKALTYVNAMRERDKDGDVTLWAQNGKGGWNDFQFSMLLSEFPELQNIIKY